MKKWEKDEIISVEKLVNDGLSYDEIAKILNRTVKSVKLKLNKLGFYCKSKDYKINKKCECCNKDFISLISENRKYCSSSCSATNNNKLRINKNKKIQSNQKCKNCENIIDNGGKIYCGLKCFQEDRKNKIYREIENGNTELSSNLYRNYLIDKYGKKCILIEFFL